MLSIFLAFAALTSDLSIYKGNPGILSGRIMSVMSSRETIRLEIGSQSCSKPCQKCHERSALYPADLKPENFGTEALPYHRLPCFHRVKTEQSSENRIPSVK
jgi:hypothetical protein